MVECTEYRLLADQTISCMLGGRSVVWTIPAGTIFELPGGFDAGPIAEIVRRDYEPLVREAA
jgi:hypothetical protein